MGLAFQIKCFYVDTFKSREYKESFITTTLVNKSTSSDLLLKTLISFEKKFNSVFSLKFYNYLFECALYTKNLVIIEYLVGKTDLSLSQNNPLFSSLHTQLINANIKNDDYFAWLIIIASHNTFHLMGIKNEKYDYTKQMDIVKFLFNHPKVQHYFHNPLTKEVVLKNCHANAKAFFEVLFMDLRLSVLNKKTPNKEVSKKVQKI